MIELLKKTSLIWRLGAQVPVTPPPQARWKWGHQWRMQDFLEKWHQRLTVGGGTNVDLDFVARQNQFLSYCLSLGLSCEHLQLPVVSINN